MKEPPADSLIAERLSYGRGSPAFSLTVASGTCVTLSGPSGSGKSLLLRLIADLVPGSGTARIGDLSRESIPANEWRRMVTYVAADSGWWTSPVSAHMPDIEGARRLFTELGLSDALMAADPEIVSSGERQRLSLVRALILKPRFLLLDEPTAALDPVSTLNVEALLAKTKEHRTGIFMVSHDPEQVARVADRRYRLSEGQLADVTP